MYFRPPERVAAEQVIIGEKKHSRSNSNLFPKAQGLIELMGEDR